VGVPTAVPRFSAISLACVGTLVASGAYQTWREVGGWQALFDTSYGRLILAKIAGLLVLIALGYLARRYIQRGPRPAGAGLPGAGLPGGGLPGAGLLGAPVPVPSAAGQGGPDAAIDGADQGNAGALRYDDFDFSRPDWRPAMRLLRRSVAVELLVACVILAFTEILVN